MSSIPRALVIGALGSTLQAVTTMLILLIVYRVAFTTLGVERIGVWSLLVASFVAIRMGEFGIATAITPRVARSIGLGITTEAARIIETGVVFVATVTFALGVVNYLVVTALMPGMLDDHMAQEVGTVLPWLVGATWFATIASVAHGALDGCKLAHVRSIVGIVSSVVYGITAVLSVPIYGLLGLAVASALQAVLSFVLAQEVLRRTLKTYRHIPRHLDIKLIRGLIRSGSWLAVAQVTNLLWAPLVRILLAKFGGYTAVGFFEMATQVVEKMRGILMAANQVVTPFMADAAVRDQKLARSLYVNSVRGVWFISFPMFGSLAVLAHAVSMIWIGYEETIFVICLNVMVAGWLANTLAAPSYFALISRDRAQWLLGGAILTLGATAALGYYAGAALGWVGVVSGTAVGLAIGSLVFPIAYHSLEELSIRHTLTRHDFGVGLATVGGIVAAHFIWSTAGEALDPFVRELLVIATFGGMVLIPLWRNPTRGQLASRMATMFFARP
ncbi:MAG: oligosaccharide flippase family protein [Gammaproteobacteria bacterium]|nr:oligosaccharide flippase family protein [Gammaproteobacteria bacterium]